MIVQSVTRHLGRPYLYVVVDTLDPGVSSDRRPTLMTLAGTWRIAGFDRQQKSIAREAGEGGCDGIEPGEELIWIG